MLETQKKSVKVGKRVNTDHVNAAIRNYKQERWVHNSKRLGKEDSLSVWYSLEELEEFLATSKAHGGDGIRLYFGAYDIRIMHLNHSMPEDKPLYWWLLKKKRRKAGEPIRIFISLQKMARLF